MRNDCVIVADRARARFFTVHAPDESDRGPHLVEHEDLVNPEGKLTGGELFGDERNGPARSPGGGPSHNYDDHRAGHLAEIGQRFARRVASAAVEFARERAPKGLVLVAEPHFLGMLRPELDARWPSDVGLTELPEELSWHSTEHIQDVLTRKGLLPAQ